MAKAPFSSQPQRGAATIFGSTASICFPGNVPTLNVGDWIVLIDAMSIDGAPKNTTASWTQGFLDYSFDIITRDGDGNGSDDEALALGLAWERELDGKARARIEGYKIDAPTLRGETGIAELSLILTPLPSKPLTLDISLQSHTGKREGITGSFRVNYRF